MKVDLVFKMDEDLKKWIQGFLDESEKRVNRLRKRVRVLEKHVEKLQLAKGRKIY